VPTHRGQARPAPERATPTTTECPAGAWHSLRNITIVTDAWHPQVNGVVHTWTYVQRELAALGHTLNVVHPSGARGIRAPGEPDLVLCTEPFRHVAAALLAAPPDAMHIATEGPLGFAARRIAVQRGWPFTTSYHTRFPEYLEARFGIPAPLTYAVVRRFHRPSRSVLVPTNAMRRELQSRSFINTRVWSRGVDIGAFCPGARGALPFPRPIFLCAGRVAPEKGLESLLSLDLPGTTVIVGDGPDFRRLSSTYPQVKWLGRRPHSELPALYRAADVFVFPSRTDTFGLVMLEAMACGCPVAAFPVTGPIDVVQPGVTGVLDESLRMACMRALALDRTRVARSVSHRGWRAIAEDLLSVLEPIRSAHPARPRALNEPTTAP
jgi:glycosyltransferase involved in cell wall biosynthesis